MKKLFSFFAAVLMAGSMMAEDATLISFSAPASAGSLNGVTFGKDFTLTITDTNNKVSVDAHNATFGVSDEDKISFTYRLKSGGKSSSANKMTLVVPEEGPLAIYARPSSGSATDRNFVIANGSDIIVDHICLDTDTVEGASSKIFLPVIVENVPAGTYELTYPVNGINFYGFQMLVEESNSATVEDPVFDPAADEFYDAQTIHLTCATEGAVILYTTDGSDPVLGSASVYYPLQGIYVGETTTIKAIAYNNDSDNPQFSDVVEKTYTIAPVYNSFDELVNEAGAPAGQKVVVNFSNVVIDSIYVSSNGKRNGIYLTAAGRMVEIYCYNAPATWEVGGTVSGTVKGEWKDNFGTWEVCPSTWEGITYKAAAGTVTPPADATFETYNASTFIYLTYDDTEWEATIAIKDNKMYIQNVLPYFINTKWIEGTIDDGVVTFAAGQVIGDLDLSLVNDPELTGVYPDCKYYGFNASFTREDAIFSWDASTKTLKLTNYESGAADDSCSEEEAYIGTDGWSDPDCVLTFVGTGVTPTGVEAVKAVKATKALVGGKVIVIRNGVRYNVAGLKF